MQRVECRMLAPRVAPDVDVWSNHVTPAVQRHDDSGNVLRRQLHIVAVDAKAGRLLVPPRLPRDWLPQNMNIAATAQ